MSLAVKPALGVFKFVVKIITSSMELMLLVHSVDLEVVCAFPKPVPFWVYGLTETSVPCMKGRIFPRFIFSILFLTLSSPLFISLDSVSSLFESVEVRLLVFTHRLLHFQPVFILLFAIVLGSLRSVRLLPPLFKVIRCLEASLMFTVERGSAKRIVWVAPWAESFLCLLIGWTWSSLLLFFLTLFVLPGSVKVILILSVLPLVEIILVLSLALLIELRVKVIEIFFLLEVSVEEIILWLLTLSFLGRITSRVRSTALAFITAVSWSLACLHF